MQGHITEFCSTLVCLFNKSVFKKVFLPQVVANEEINYHPGTNNFAVISKSPVNIISANAISSGTYICLVCLKSSRIVCLFTELFTEKTKNFPKNPFTFP